ncbi:MAG: diacylglycerol kinase family protein [Clostridia bacterium]
MKRGIRKLRKSFGFALDGIKYCVNNERNFRIHLVAIAYVLIFSHLAQISTIEFAIMMMCFAQVLSAELLNTAIECLCNRTGFEYNIFIKNAKDIAAAAVLVCAISCVIIGLVIFTPKIGIILANLTVIYIGILIILTLINLWFIFKRRT